MFAPGRRFAAVMTADGGTLWFARPRVAALHRLADRPGRTFAELGADRTVALCAAAALWLVAAWVAVGVLTVAGSTLPGTFGRACAGLGRVAVPITLRHVVGVALGIGLVAGPAALASASAATPAPGWPAAPTSSQPGPQPGTTPTTPPGRVPAPTPTPHAPPRHHAPTAPRETSVRVRAGDSLWLIAARHLPDHAAADHAPADHAPADHAPEAQVAAYWPRVYAANRAVVGPDPGHITPGQVLRLPDPTDSR